MGGCLNHTCHVIIIFLSYKPIVHKLYRLFISNKKKKKKKKKSANKLFFN
jgi:hypothetical protein